jgi:hypothetical protein
MRHKKTLRRESASKLIQYNGNNPKNNGNIPMVYLPGKLGFCLFKNA